MINQLKGALKMLFVLILALGALEIWILKDNRHFSIAIYPDNLEQIVVEKQALQVYGEMN